MFVPKPQSSHSCIPGPGKPSWRWTAVLVMLGWALTAASSSSKPCFQWVFYKILRPKRNLWRRLPCLQLLKGIWAQLAASESGVIIAMATYSFQPVCSMSGWSEAVKGMQHRIQTYPISLMLKLSHHPKRQKSLEKRQVVLLGIV